MREPDVFDYDHALLYEDMEDFYYSHILPTIAGRLTRRAAVSGTAQGFVAKIFTKSGDSKRGKWVADSFKIEDEEGNEDPYFYQMGFREKGKLDVPPKFKEGDYIVFDYEDKDDSARKYLEGTGKIKKNKVKSASTSTASAGGAPASGGGNTQQNIHYQNSRTAAIELVGLLLEHKALPVTGANSKAGTAARYDEITAAVDQLTVKLFNDLESFRLFETVQDIGVVDTSADGDLPDEPEDVVVTDDDDDEPI